MSLHPFARLVVVVVIAVYALSGHVRHGPIESLAFIHKTTVAGRMSVRVVGLVAVTDEGKPNVSRMS